MTVTFYLLPSNQEQTTTEATKHLTETIKRNNSLLEQQLLINSNSGFQQATETIPGLSSQELRDILVETKVDFSIRVISHKDIGGNIDGILGYMFIPEVKNKTKDNYVQLHGFLQTDCSFAGQPGALCDMETGLYTPSTDPEVISFYEALRQKLRE